MSLNKYQTFPLAKNSDLFKNEIENNENTNISIDWIEDAIEKKYIKYYDCKYFSDIQEIGTGGFGKVYRVKWKNSEYYLALKTFKDPDNVTIKEIVRELNFQRDVDHHNNIIRFHGISKSVNSNNQMKIDSLVMEYADGGNLRGYLKEHFNNLTWNDKLNMALQLACAHSGNVLVHQNIIKLADFARKIEEVSKTHSGSFGVVPYIDPKKFNSEPYTLNKMSDIYSLGVLLWEISSGQPPFKDELYEFLHECWDSEPDNRPIIHQVVSRLKEIITKEYGVMGNHHLLSPNKSNGNSSRSTKSTTISSNQIININFTSEKDVRGFRNIRSQSMRAIKREIMHVFCLLRTYVILTLKKCVELTANIYRYIFWRPDVKTMVDKTVELIFELINGGTEWNSEKQQILNYLNNNNDHNINSKIIYNWLLINQNYSNSIFLLGCFNYYGIETNKNYEKAYKLFVNKSVQNHILALYYVGHCYMFGYGTLKDEKSAFKYYEMVANKGCVGGQNNVGYCYSHGKGVKKDLKKAISWYEKAANNGNANAQRNLGVKYMDGEGVDKNDNKAFELFKKSAEGGNSKGIMMLGYCYDCGIGTNIDKYKAAELYQYAANLGNITAQYNLAMLYENGEGIIQDMNLAIYWYKKSSEQGNQDAQKMLDNLMKLIETKKELIYRISY
ncbi:kinase-like domain-containing protein [Rhizophagus irregularis DAOM 181602=DAOM 197198]|nr:kinase-like domain-containing protein [Rhizophagus irregularis DAOM 181602=DAOM 197198]